MDLSAPPADDPLLLALQRELQPGETIAWSGEKLPRIAWGGFAIWFFAIPWTAFSLFWMAGASAGAAAGDATVGPLIWAFPLFGFPFLLVGLAMLTAPFLPTLAAGRVRFAVTDRRIIRVGLFGRRLWTRSVEIAQVDEISRTERANGEGSLTVTLHSEKRRDGSRDKIVFPLGVVADVMKADRALHATMEARISS